MKNTKSDNAEAVRSGAWLGKSGFDALREWNNTFKHHHLPMWAKKRVRLLAIECGEWKAGISIHEEFLPHKVFDHWGSIVRGDNRALYAMPYAEPDALAKIWAEVMDCTLESFFPGPWNEATKCYVFFPNDGADARRPRDGVNILGDVMRKFC